MSSRTIFVWVGRAEAVSFLVLLGVAMPLKYALGHPEATTLAGWLHGMLFLGYGIALARVSVDEGWPWTRAAVAFVAALLPFGPFVFERRILAMSPA
jgi:integral membrane protein